MGFAEDPFKTIFDPDAFHIEFADSRPYDCANYRI
jgi:hypothetical protein